MSNEIKVHKNTMYLMVGLFLAIIIGAYLVFGASPNGAATTNTVSCTSGKDCSPSDRQLPPINLIAPSGADKTAGEGQPSGLNLQAQDVYLKATGSGYDKSEITVKKGVPVRLHFTAKNAGCGNQLVIYGLNVKALSRGEEAVVEFTPQKEGIYQFNCGMKMFPPGKFIVSA